MRKKKGRGKRITARVNKPTHAKKTPRRKKPARRKKHARGKSQIVGIAAPREKGLGPDAGGQSGDTQGLPQVADADSESVEELAEEGQTFEAEVVSGVESAPDADEAEVTTKEVPEDDLPPEYRERE
jgi:N utilization substance protein A